MDQKTLDKVRHILEARKEELLESMKTIGHKGEVEDEFDADLPDYGDSEEDNATEVADYVNNLSLEKELHTDITNVEKALEKVESGTYGKCESCGQEIDPARLNIRPESIYCIECTKKLNK
ncbi:MAG: TraR/DksA family transcriptional regulator [bacterium]